MKILSFDVGGSKIFWALTDENGRMLSQAQMLKTPKTAAEIENIFRKVCQENRFDGFALATAGVVLNNKISGKPNNLPAGYENIDFSDFIKTPYVIENDANSAMWAEYKTGALVGGQHGVMLTLGTDVGCGIICNGQIMRGKCGAAGEVCFDCSGRSLQRLAQEYSSAETDCFAIRDTALRQNGAERTAYKEWQQNLIESVCALNRILDTEIVALSGSLAQIVDYAIVNTAVKLLQPHNAPQIRAAVCENYAGLIGAALLCAQKLKG